MNTKSMETWCAIPGFSRYEVSDYGQVRSFVGPRNRPHNPPKILKQTIMRSGHRNLRLTNDDGERCLWLVHRLVLTAFVGPAPDGMYGLHRDDDPSNNRLTNLRWGTQAENMADMVLNGHACSGERSIEAKLTESIVRQIRKEKAAGGVTYKELSARYGVSQGALCDMVKRRTWSHVQ